MLTSTVKVVYAYGQYQDDWIKTCCPEEWRINARTLVYMVCPIYSHKNKSSRLLIEIV